MDSIESEYDGTAVVNRVKGAVGFEEIAEFISKNVQLWVGRPLIWDFTQKDFDQVSTEELRAFAARMRTICSSRSGQKTAFVATEDAKYGMMRMFEAMADIVSVGTDIEVFRTIDDANVWIAE